MSSNPVQQVEDVFMNMLPSSDSRSHSTELSRISTVNSGAYLLEFPQNCPEDVKTGNEVPSPWKEKAEDEIAAVQIQTTPKRFLILALFILISMTNAFHWIEYSIISNVVEDHYGVSNVAVEWTSMVFMVSYIPLIFPATWALETYGFRRVVLLGALGTFLGSWVKSGSLFNEYLPATTRWIFVFVGQCIVATSQVFTLGIPSHLAATWFPANEVSSAASAGVFGNQLGIALGFLIPPIVVPVSEIRYETELGFRQLTLGQAFLISAIFFASLWLLRDQPENPPSIAAAQAKTSRRKLKYLPSLYALICDVNYVLLLITYGMNVGVFYAISTLLNRIILFYFPGAEKEAGQIGLTIVILGMAGSIFAGWILDKTHAFKYIHYRTLKAVTVIVYILSLVGMILFSGALHSEYLSFVYVASALLGFSMTGYLPLGFEFAVELTFPEPEGTTSGLLNCSAQIFGLLITNVASSVSPLEKIPSSSVHSMRFKLWCSFALLDIEFVGTDNDSNHVKRNPCDWCDRINVHRFESSETGCTKASGPSSSRRFKELLLRGEEHFVTPRFHRFDP
ncbi:unnamed protein product [Darwinula stevensoni]|uniref:Major facilitator superfamily (MFS) profile domain-containing protein n=1 Tax=Darwinula stevensoni TaxID=69355 RepID=A0A7R8X0S9_9CRUS|nr:unnamed protein product [Darwinula stevensoni]CAG0882020.1 unnamed protein product [Darwinula stevensoni]